MSDLNDKEGIWFVYDGDCPVCTHAAEALRIKQEYGQLTILDARKLMRVNGEEDPLIAEINRRGLDLDEGMVIYADQQFYHGKDALKFMAKYGDSSNVFTSVFKALFWSETLSGLLYPWMRACRNWLLGRKKVGRIDNLNLKNEPTFKAVFGQSWHELPLVLRKHYANHPYTEEVTTFNGILDVTCKPPLLWMSPVMRLLGQIPAYNQAGVPVTVHFESETDSKAFSFNRVFHFSTGKPYHFHSRMYQIQADEVVEIMRFGFGWRMKYSWDGEKVILAHKGYAVQLMGHLIPLPITALLGKGYAEEYPIDDNTFDMNVSIVHPWFGKMYGYQGRFEVSN